MWPMLLDISKDECRGILRRLELEAYASLLSAFRAQGALGQTKREILDQIRTLLHINLDRHKAEIRRVTNDETLSTVAERLCGGNTMLDWSSAGRRTVPLFSRGRLESAYTALADSIAREAYVKNKEIKPTSCDAVPPRKELADHPNVVMHDVEQTKLRERGRKRQRGSSEEHIPVPPPQAPPPPPPQTQPSTSKSSTHLSHHHPSRKISQLHTNAKIKQLYNSQSKNKGRHHGNMAPSSSKHSSTGHHSKIKTNRGPSSHPIPSTSFAHPTPIVASRAPSHKIPRKMLEMSDNENIVATKPTVLESSTKVEEHKPKQEEIKKPSNVIVDDTRRAQQKVAPLLATVSKAPQMVSPAPQIVTQVSQNQMPVAQVMTSVVAQVAPSCQPLVSQTAKVMTQVAPQIRQVPTIIPTSQISQKVTIASNNKIQYVVTTANPHKVNKVLRTNQQFNTPVSTIVEKIHSSKPVTVQNISAQQMISNTSIKTGVVRQHPSTTNHNGRSVKLVSIAPGTNKTKSVATLIPASGNKLNMPNTTFAQLKPVTVANIAPTKVQKIQFTDANHYGKTNFILLQKQGLKNKEGVTIMKDGKEIAGKIVMPPVVDNMKTIQEVKQKEQDVKKGNVIVLGLTNAHGSKHSVLAQILQASGMIPAGSKSEIIIKNVDQATGNVIDDTTVVMAGNDMQNNVVLPDRPTYINKQKIVKQNVVKLDKNVIENNVNITNTINSTDWEEELDNASNKYTVHVNISNANNNKMVNVGSGGAIITSTGEIKCVNMIKMNSNSNDASTLVDASKVLIDSSSIDLNEPVTKLENTQTAVEMTNSELMRILNGSPEAVSASPKHEITRDGNDIFQKALASADINLESGEYLDEKPMEIHNPEDRLHEDSIIYEPDMENMIVEVSDNNYYTENKDVTTELCGLDLNNLDSKAYGVYEANGTSQNYEIGATEVEMSLIPSMEVT